MSKKHGIRSFLIVYPILLTIIFPLFFHKSNSVEIFSYSYHYFYSLVAVNLFAVSISFFAAFHGFVRANHYLSLRLFLFFSVLSSFFLLSVVIYDDFSYGGAEKEMGMWGLKASIVSYGTANKEDYTWSIANATYSTDKLGFRTHVREPEWFDSEEFYSHDNIRIFVVGGSSVLGFGLNDNETWAHLLEGELKGSFAHKNVTVINAGVNGFTSLNIIMHIYERILEHHPDFIIYYEQLNDFCDYNVFHKDRIANYEKYLFSQSDNQLLSMMHSDKNIYMRTGLGYRAEKLSDLLFGTGFIDEVDELLCNTNNDLTKEYMRNIETISDMCDRAGAELVLVTFLDGVPHNKSNYKESDYPEIYNRYVNNKTKEYNEILRQIASVERIPLIDLEDEFQEIADKKRYFFDDRIHPNRKGAEYISRELASKLIKIIKE